MLNVGSAICGFHVDSVTDISDVNGRMWRMTYEKNGAELVWLERDDEVKTFVIAFKTLPEDDTGVAHILEHSVLAGSEKYPVKSPFDEMRKSSVRVFMNAMTSRDATYYPFSTRNDADYLNLADVYLDAVFHPLALKEPSAFMQEGWHYEWDKSNRELSVNGVVFNEMKGVFALPERRAYRELTSALYPDIVYGHDSGGRPEKIPELTYEKYCAFHKRFYHPSNARIFIDGKVQIKDVLAKLDSYLSGFDRLDVKADIPSQKPIDVKLRIPYESAKCENKTILIEGWSAGLSADPVYGHALEVLADYLCGSNEAPLKKVLLEKKLCRDVSMDCIDYHEIPLYIILKDTSEDKLDECRKTIRDTLADVREKGFDKRRLNALINRDEFAERELDTTRPKGLIFFSMVFRRWLYGGNPAAALSLSDIYAKLRAGVDNGMFETILRERILANRHHAEVVMSPDAGPEKRRIAENKARMETVRDAMKDSDVKRLVEDMAKLKEYQHRKDSPEDIAKIPRLRSSELSQAGIPVSGEVQKENGVVRIKTKTTADGVFYLSMYFPMDDLAEDELLKMPLFAKLLGKLRTSRHSALELQTEIAGNVGRISYSPISTTRGRYFKVSVASLLERRDDSFGLLKEVLLNTRFEDMPEIEAVLRQKQLAAERDVSRDGRDFALCYAKRGIGERWMASDLLHGERQLRWLQGASADAELSNWYANLPPMLFRKNGMVVSYTDNLDDEAVNELLSSFGDGIVEEREILIVANNLNGFSIDGDTGFAAWVAKLPDGVTENGAMRVAAKILSLEYLHNEVREIGGAYGVTMRVTPGGLVECLSYRDPNPCRSLQKMDGLGGALRRFVESGADIDRYIVATIASMEPYRSPADEASRAVRLFVENRDGEDVERVRREVLSTTKDQLLKFADLLDKVTTTRTTCVIGGDRQVADIGAGQIQPVMKSMENRLCCLKERCNTFRKLYIIGNGFDIHHGLKTGYADFHKWLQQQNDYSSVEEMECFFAVEDLWKDFEENLGKLNYPNIVMEITRDYIPSPAEEHYEARLSDAQVEVENTIKDWRDYIQNGLAKWIKCVGKPDASKRLSLDPDAFYVTFNYTKTLENLYSIAAQNILHIHGCIGGLPRQLVLGHGGAEGHSISEIVYEPKIVDGEVDDSSYDESYEISKQFAFTAAEAIVKGWGKPVDAILKRNNHVLAGLASVEEVVVLGLSFSDADRRYFARFREIIKNTAKWKVSWFGESDKRNIRLALRGIGVKYALIRMKDLQINQNTMEVDDL